MQVQRRSPTQPFFSVCIPQYNRTSFLIESLRVLDAQTFRDFEVCISDDRSNDGRTAELVRFLEDSSLYYTYCLQSANLRYDANIRASIGLAVGRYCFLHGNDDCLATNAALAELQREIILASFPAVAICNFEDWASATVTRRVRREGVYGSGPAVAARHYRDVSFVTGVVLDTTPAQVLATAKWDGSEMYQMYLVARMIAQGGRLLGLERSLVRKDIRIAGETVDSYARKPSLRPCPIVERTFPFGSIGRLVADAIGPSLSPRDRASVLRQMLAQLYLFTYPFWIVEYRRIQSWRYALGVCLGIRPRNVFTGLGIGPAAEFQLRLCYLASCLAGLLVPIALFDRLKPVLYRIAKARRRS